MESKYKLQRDIITQTQHNKYINVRIKNWTVNSTFSFCNNSAIRDIIYVGTGTFYVLTPINVA